MFVGAHGHTHSISRLAPFFSCRLPWIIIQPEGWMLTWLWFYILSWLLEVPLPKQCNFPLWQWCLPTQLSCPSSWTCSYTCMPKGPRGTRVTVTEGRTLCRWQCHSQLYASCPQNPSLCTCIPRTWQALLGSAPSEHTDPGVRAARGQARASSRLLVAAIRAGNVEMFGLSLHTITEICQPFSDFKLDVLGWRN